jgi:poly-gamma-glutamate capsule biosynthesis protein CapA/YwtB (metallophosphatase superfamily)
MGLPTRGESYSPTITLFLCGDVMIGRGVDQILPNPSNPALHEPYVQSALEYVEMAERANGPIPKPAGVSYIWGDAAEELDHVAPAVRIVNLETSITACEDYDPKGINYRMHPANTPCLTAAKIDCCVLANNHVMDWGRSGLMETLASLQGAGVKTAGAGPSVDEATKPAVIEIGGHARVLVFAAGIADSGIPRDWAATDRESGVAWFSDLSGRTIRCMAENVRAVKRPGDIAVLSIHWGENWGYRVPQEQRLFAHRLLDLGGVDVIHGHSSHHPKGIEVYRGKPILYGCGDFLNDYEGIAGYEEYRSHLVLMYFVTVDVEGRLLALEMTPFEIKRFSLHHATGQDAQWLRDTLSREGKRLDTQVTLSTKNHLVVQWP